ncbi:gluconokinase [Litorihabitans aurantiacus]|uniref:Gluconate kinase n=1 Tax=Litorihabitans aurantiacus TaxID=1930061 RepID=A0AA37XGT7_9MICO|nr:gluconokinase [Litorihabitans aurantiacus]GMA33388.1 gluconate kinase [Litorihabitans aurantiacus]
MGVVIGIDVGTTTTKVLALDPEDADHRWRAVALREYRLVEPAPRHQVQDPRTVLGAVDDALAEVVAACTAAGRTVDVLGVGTAMHGLVALDAELRPITDIVTWADTRAHAQAARLRADGRGLELHHRSGTPVHPMSPLVKLAWFTQEDADTAAAAHRWIGLKDLVLLHLTGRLVTELSTASCSGLLDLSTRTWAPEHLDIAGVRAEQLPPVLPTTALLELSPAAAARSGLPAGTPVNTGATDGPLGNLGTGAIAPGIAGLSMGTSGAVRTVVREPVLDDHGRLFCYALTDDAWVVGAPMSNGGVVARWAGEVYASQVPAGPERDAHVMAMAARVPAGSDGLVMLPYLLGERAPLWDPELTGSFLGVRHEHGPDHFVRAAIEGVAVSMGGLIEVLGGVTPVEQVRCTGGVFQAEVWRRVMAAAIDRPLVPTDDAEGSALGGAALALYALGRADSLAGALELLSPADGVADPIEVDAADREVYRGMRRRTAAMLEAYDGVRAYLAGD